MKKIVKHSAKKQASLVLTGTLVASSVIPSLGNAIDLPIGEVVRVNEVVTQRTTDSAITMNLNGTPQKGETYLYSFSNTAAEVIVPTTYDSSNPINTLYSPDGLVKINGGGKMYHHNSNHGLVIKNGNSFEVKVAGDAVISFSMCAYSKDGAVLTATSDAASGSFATDEMPLKADNKDGDTVSFEYTGPEATLTFTVNGATGDNYLHGFDVRNIGVNKDFSLKIGDVEFDLQGTTAVGSGALEAVVSEGDVYYTLSDKAYVSIDLKNETLRPTLIQNNSPNVVDAIDVDNDGNIVVTFKDQSTMPSTYTIKVQDRSKFKKPGLRDAYSFDFKNQQELIDLTSVTKIEERYTMDNGILTIGKGNGSSAPHWYSTGHGALIYDKNYIEVAVAGNATIEFDGCAYGEGGTFRVEGLVGTGSFDNDEIKGACDRAITYTYEGDATTLRFTLNSTGKAYVHGVTVKNKGQLVESPVANTQAAMPKKVDKQNTLEVVPVGQRLLFEHADNASNITDLSSGLSYYLFDAIPDVATIEADVRLSAIGSGSSQGLLMGLFEDAQDIKEIATVGLRGDGKIRNIYNKQGENVPVAGGIDQTYSANDIIHITVKKTAEGWYSEVTAGDKTSNGTIKYSNTQLLGDVNTSVRYGFAFSNVNGMITNLTFKDEAGTVLYDQKDCYDAIGTAPNVKTVEMPVISSDRKTITVNWSGDNCEEDAAYQVSLSKDGGQSFEVLSTDVKEKTYTADVVESGEYIFEISGVCGKQTTGAKLSPAVEVVAALASPVLTGESGDQAITLSWEDVPGATSYEVYRKSVAAANYSLLKEVNSLTYTDTAIQNEEPYYYYVMAKSANNTSNPSNELLMVASSGREGKYVYEKDATKIFVTKKSYDTVYKNQATLEGIVDKTGKLALEVNGKVQQTLSLNKKDTFALKAQLTEGRNDVNLLFTDEAGKVTRQTFNFVYLTNYDIVVDGSYQGADGAAATDGTGAKMYSSVQAAIDSVPSGNTNRVVILVKAGNYKEYLRVSSPYITLVGEDREKVNINYYDAVETPAGGDTDKRCAVYVQSSATGFAAENLTFENTYNYLGDGTISNESADALRVDADEAAFVNVKLLGYQDTLQVNKNRQYFYKCYIGGNIDYIYGTDSRALFNDCDLVYRYNANKNSGYIVAPKTDIKYEYGYIFNDCRVIAEEGCNGAKYLLGRPWGPDAAATFINTYMSGIVNKAVAYSDMSGNLHSNARFNEYYSYGDGYAINGNRPQISKAQADEMLTTSFLGWDPYEVIANVSEDNFIGSVVTTGEEKFVEKEYIEESANPDSTDDTGLGAFSIEGYAQNVTGGGVLLETASTYYKVNTAEAFLEAIATIKKTGKPSVIELTEDISLGSIEIGSALTKYSNIIKDVNNGPLLHPTLIKSGVSTLSLKDMSNLTIYSKNGSALEHVCIDVNNSSNIIFRNVVFDELWEWDEGGYMSNGEYCDPGDYDRNDWDYLTVQNGSTDIWIDHCTFYKAYDGVVDIKKADSGKPSNVTISWSRFLPESETTFFDEMMDLLEKDPSKYPYYNKLLTKYGMTKEQIRGYASAQKKTHLIGASDTEANTYNLQLTLANNYYKSSMDRMPRLRGGSAHVYNCILDASDLYALRNSIENPEARAKVVSNGALSTCGASVLLENTYIDGIINALASGNAASPGGYINAVNSAYYMGGELTELKVTDNAGAGMILDADKFTSGLPYKNYNLYNVNALDTQVIPYTGAGTIDMCSVQWQKTTYNETVTDTDKAQQCTVTFDYQGGNAVEESMKVTVGEAYKKLPVPTRSGYTFVGWYTQLTGGEKVDAATIVTNEQDHTLYARWSKKSSGSSNGGSGSSNGSSSNNTTSGNNAAVENNNSNNAVDSSTVSGLKDISGHWAKDSITYVASKGILKGVKVGAFEPNAPMTRAMFATVLHRLSDEPAAAVMNQFKDIKADAWYAAAITWANEQGIVNGVGQNAFKPNAQVTREQMAVMLYNYMKVSGIEFAAAEEKVVFADSDKVASWAQEAMSVMAQTGIMQGDNKQNCNPKAKATRAEVSTMLHRFMEMVEAGK